MDLENKNNVVDTDKADEITETEKAIDSFLNGSVYTEEDAKKDKEASKFVTNKEAAICAISVFALAVWNLSGYGAILIAAVALLSCFLMGSGKNAVQVCVSNALTLGIMAVIRVAFSVISVFLQTFYFFVLEESLPTKLSNFFSLATNLVGIIVFIFFVINMFYLMSKKHTPLFGNTAKKFAEREE